MPHAGARAAFDRAVDEFRQSQLANAEVPEALVAFSREAGDEAAARRWQARLPDVQRP